MIISTFVDRLYQFASRLGARQWASWEILIIAIIALVVLLWIIRRRRVRKLRKIYEGHFQENSPVIGVNLRGRKRSHHGIKDLTRDRPASINKHQKQQPAKTTESSEKLHEEIKQLQNEIVKRKQAESHLEQQVAQLTADNERLQRELAETKQAGQKAADVPAVEEQVRPEVSQVKQVEQKSEQQTVAEPAIDKTVEIKPAGRDADYESHHRVVDGVRQKLCRKCKEWKAEDEFHKSSSSKDGLAGACRMCKTNIARDYRKRRKAVRR
jgi:hypothetical protein